MSELDVASDTSDDSTVELSMVVAGVVGEWSRTERIELAGDLGAFAILHTGALRAAVASAAASLPGRDKLLSDLDHYLSLTSSRCGTTNQRAQALIDEL
jgi:hypothetical protein